LFDSGLVVRAVEQLQASGHVLPEGRRRWFRSTVFGDERTRGPARQRPVTYFCVDIAYTSTSFSVASTCLVNVWVPTINGYSCAREGCALQALRLDPRQLTIALYNSRYSTGETQKVSMSTRAGES